MKFLIEKDGSNLYIKAIVGEQKRMLRAGSAEELISAMNFFEKLAVSNIETFEAVKTALEKTEDRAFLEAAIGQWLAKGNKIKVLPRVEGKNESVPKAKIGDLLEELGLGGTRDEVASKLSSGSEGGSSLVEDTATQASA